MEARDADTGSNGDVHYRMKQDLAGHWRTFSIDETTGMISLQLPLDRETQKLYEVLIKSVAQAWIYSNQNNKPIGNRFASKHTIWEYQLH